MTDTDEALAGRARRGDRAAFDALVGRYQGRVYHLALRFCGRAEEARELAQEVFMRVYLKLGAYHPERPFRPWLRQVATRVFLNAADRRRLPVRSLEPSSEEARGIDPPAGPADDPVRRAEARELQQRVHAALLQLPPHYRAAMLLRHVEDLSYEEIAAALGLPIGTVKTHIHRARGRLRELLGEVLPEALGEGS